MYNTRISTTQDSAARDVTLAGDVTRMRLRTQDTAQRLSLVAIRNWEKAVTGVVAVPAALALSTAAGVLFATSLIEHGFEIFERTLADLGRRVTDEFDAHGEPRPDIPAARASSPS